ncbi:MAG: DUF4390 domain-containing protein [Methylibium sp.]|uniref:DUF4390 domain-containing protein n=1 Tax=Methylibium sp. TaxID=2067992 RepID=UPI0018401341|nr:DUF4390 domain-containing protein [Methylibium sp.]MBA3598668.1 DUF4390 domain-containing protein [Methylibium sp.]
MFTAWVRCCFQARAGRRTGRGWSLLAFVAVLLGLAGPPAAADGFDLLGLDLTRNEEGLLLAYDVQVVLPQAVEQALRKGVPLYFVAHSEVWRPRWYWRDARVAEATRNWRLTWQPLTRRYRVNFGSLSDNYDTLAGALGAIERATRWKLADADALEVGADHYVEFSFRLDTSQLPRPLQIGFEGEADWELAIERTLAVPPPSPPAAAPSAALR